jgi:hydrogenase expression/formation protein HypC
MCLAIPAKIVEFVPGDQQRALVEVVGVRRQVDMGLLQDEVIKPGDWVLVHVGFAMSKIGEEQALEQLRTLTMLGEEQAAFEEVKGYGLSEPEVKDGP